MFICRRRIWSSAPNGSSMNSTRGSVTSARAIATRWRMPPESSPGSACSKPRRPTSPIRSRMRDAARADRPAEHLERQRDVASRPCARAAAPRPGRRRRSAARAAPPRATCRRSAPGPSSSGSSPSADPQDRRLAAAGRADQRGERAGRAVERDVAQRLDRLSAPGIGLAEAGERRCPPPPGRAPASELGEERGVEHLARALDADLGERLEVRRRCSPPPSRRCRSATRSAASARC